jgi:hypothetical protein
MTRKVDARSRLSVRAGIIIVAPEYSRSAGGVGMASHPACMRSRPPALDT